MSFDSEFKFGRPLPAAEMCLKCCGTQVFKGVYCSAHNATVTSGIRDSESVGPGQTRTTSANRGTIFIIILFLNILYTLFAIILYCFSIILIIFLAISRQKIMDYYTHYFISIMLIIFSGINCCYYYNYCIIILIILFSIIIIICFGDILFFIIYSQID